MPRKPRIHYPGAAYHVILRGNDGQDTFFDPGDRTRFYLLLQEGSERYGCRIHSFCLMTNHVHLVIQVGTIPLSRIMQNIGFRYTLFINTKRKRTGHLFQGRYKALLLDTDTYLLELIRYVHMNPVRAGLCSSPDHYPWSSHKAYLGREAIPWLTTAWILSQLADTEVQARRLFGEFVNKEDALEYRREFLLGSTAAGIIGDAQFAEQAVLAAEMETAPRISQEEIIDHVCCAYGLHAGEIRAGGKQRKAAEARSMIAWLVREMVGLTLAALTEPLNREATALSLSASRLESRAKSDPLLRGRMEEIRSGLLKC